MQKNLKKKKASLTTVENIAYRETQTYKYPANAIFVKALVAARLANASLSFNNM